MSARPVGIHAACGQPATLVVDGSRREVRCGCAQAAIPAAFFALLSAPPEAGHGRPSLAAAAPQCSGGRR